jgi:hypothetical protein
MNRWAFVPSAMDVGHCYHTATLLQNGQILIVGGINPFTFSSVNSNVQLYDPPSNTFITKASLNTAHWLHTATLLNDGQLVLIIGGLDTMQQILSTAEVYADGLWSTTAGDMFVARRDHAVVLLPNGNVLVAGGSHRYYLDWSSDMGDHALASVKIYNSATRTFSPAQSMACARSKLTLTLLPSGKVLAVGGISSPTDECPFISELYDPTTDQWISTRLLNSVRYGLAAVLINNSVLAIGGSISVYTQLKQCERYHL